MKKTIVSLAMALSLILGAGFANAAGNNTAQQKLVSEKKVAGKKKTASWLFVVSAGKGFIKRTGRKTYTLHLKLPDFNQVTMYTDRPKRIAHSISAKKLAKIWKNGTNSFAANPPNATVSFEDMRPIVMTVTKIKIQGNLLTLTLKLLKGQTPPKPNRQVTKVVLTIDDSTAGACWCQCTCSCTASSNAGGCYNSLDCPS